VFVEDTALPVDESTLENRGATMELMAPDSTGELTIRFRPAYGEFVSEEPGMLSVTVKGDDVMLQISDATLADEADGDSTVSPGDEVAVTATVTDEGGVSRVAVNESGFEGSAPPADGPPVDKGQETDNGQAASPGDQAGGRAGATGKSIEVESVEADVSAFDAGGSDGTVDLTDEDGDDTYEATFTVGENASEGEQSAEVIATDEAENSVMEFTNKLTVATPPSAQTEEATDVGGTGATLNGTVDPNGAETTVEFTYYQTADSANTAQTVTADQSPLQPGDGEQDVSADVTELDSGTEYGYVVEAENDVGSDEGREVRFKINE
jgi:hypothetical protein